MIEYITSTIHDGDMTDASRRATFLQSHGISTESLVYMEQVHQTAIHVIEASDLGHRIPGVDGVIADRSMRGSNTPVALGVLTADCVPVMVWNDKEHVLATAHAGWRGTLGNIAQTLVHQLPESVDRTLLHAYIGPYIGPCCYDIPASRTGAFVSTDRQYTEAIEERDGKTYLDLGLINQLQLVHSGLSADHIEVSTHCTCCETEMYFSYRRGGESRTARMMHVLYANT